MFEKSSAIPLLEQYLYIQVFLEHTVHVHGNPRINSTHICTSVEGNFRISWIAPLLLSTYVLETFENSQI